jgi:hypothetical protein
MAEWPKGPDEMNACDFDAVTYDADVYCVECLPHDVDVDSEDVGPIFADQEWDYYPVCCNCGRVHEYVSLLPPSADDLDTFLDAYVECALWSSMDESDDRGGEPMDANYTADDIGPATLKEMRNDCQAFMTANRADIGDRFEQAGHDYWMTRNGHGAGFWDGDWSDEAGKRLTEAAHADGSYDLYVGDDGVIYGS